MQLDLHSCIFIPQATGIDHGQAHSGARTALHPTPQACGVSRGQASVNGRLHRALSRSTQVASGLGCALLTGSLACSHSPTPIQVSQSGAGAYEAALATDETGFAVAWYDVRDGNAEIYMRLLDEHGRPTGPPRRLTATPDASYEPSIERLADTFVVAWYEQAAEKQRTAMLGAWDRDGERKWVQAIPGSRNPVTRTFAHGIVAAWIQAEADGSENVWVGWWDRDGHERRSRSLVGAASKTTWNLNLALDGSDAWVVFDAAVSTRASELFIGRAGESSGAGLVRLTRDDGVDSKYPDLKLSATGRFALTWYDMRDGNAEVYLVVGDRADPGEIDGRAHRVTRTVGESIGAYLAWNGERVGLAWSDETAGAHEVFFQSFNGSGSPVASAERLTWSETWSLVPAIQPWRKGFALAWTEYRHASSQVHDGTGEVAFTLVVEPKLQPSSE